jgi:hypothetical protein
MARRAALAAFVVAAVAAASATAAPAPVRVDRDHGVRFDLEGSVLNLRLLRPEAGEQVWGKNVEAICSPAFRPRQARRPAVSAVQLWPEGQTELSYQFERDISERVKWCLLEEPSGADIAGVDFQVFFPVYGTSADDRRMGRRLRRYLWRNASSRPWLRRVSGVVVDQGVIAVATRLRRTRYGLRSAREICNLIQGADVADFTPGHSVFGHNEVRLRTCPARSRPNERAAVRTTSPAPSARSDRA